MGFVECIHHLKICKIKTKSTQYFISFKWHRINMFSIFYYGCNVYNILNTYIKKTNKHTNRMFGLFLDRGAHIKSILYISNQNLTLIMTDIK